MFFSSFFFNDTATTEIYTLSLHDALPISVSLGSWRYPSSPVFDVQKHSGAHGLFPAKARATDWFPPPAHSSVVFRRSEEHTSELQSQSNLVCRLLLEKKKKNQCKTII